MHSGETLSEPSTVNMRISLQFLQVSFDACVIGMVAGLRRLTYAGFLSSPDFDFRGAPLFVSTFIPVFLFNIMRLRNAS